MDWLQGISGVVVQAESPDWAPLEAALGDVIGEWFMWMHEIRLADGLRLHAYKHVTTRRYLHLASHGFAFDHRIDGSYGIVALPTAIMRAFSGWERAQPPPRHVRALCMAVEAARRQAA